MYVCSEASHEVRIGRDELKVRVDVGTKPLCVRSFELRCSPKPWFCSGGMPRC